MAAKSPSKSADAIKKAEEEAEKLMAEISMSMDRAKNQEHYVHRKGTWCKVFGLTKATDMNGLIVQLLTDEVDKDGMVTVEFAKDSIKCTYSIQPHK